MKFTGSRKEIFEAISAAATATSSRTTVNILTFLKFDAQGGAVRVLGCDGELWVVRTFAAEVQEDGATCLPAKTLQDLMAALSDDAEVTIETSDRGSAHLVQGNSLYTLPTLDPADFNEPPDYGGEAEIKLTLSELKAAVEAVHYAVSVERHRYVLTGVLFNYNGQTLTLVATDTHRLAVKKLEKPGIGDNINAVVPEKALRAMKQLPVADDAEVELRFGVGRVGVNAGGAQVVSLLVTGTYPNWERVVPNESTRVWTVESDQLLNRVKRCNIIARDNMFRIKFSGNEEQITISAHSDERGEAKEEVDVVGKNGQIEIAFNGKYVQEALSAIEGPGVTIEMTESSRPAVFRPADDDENSYFCVIMPMAL
jgi:DNA polymerase-3 subunit beta